jgi:signal transduction histidine kinase
VGDLLGEMRATLGVLRGVDEDPPRQAVAGLARLDELAADNRRAGLPVTVERHGVVRDLPTGVDGAAYRIVQESLTNTRRHADARTATVTLTYTDDELIVQIDDDGPPTVHPPAPGGGTGLAGMRERAVALGGTLDAGPRPDGGFRVRGRLPLTPTRTSSGAGAP